MEPYNRSHTHRQRLAAQYRQLVEAPRQRRIAADQRAYVRIQSINDLPADDLYKRYGFEIHRVEAQHVERASLPRSLLDDADHDLRERPPRASPTGEETQEPEAPLDPGKIWVYTAFGSVPEDRQQEALEKMERPAGPGALRQVAHFSAVTLEDRMANAAQQRPGRRRYRVSFFRRLGRVKYESVLEGIRATRATINVVRLDDDAMELTMDASAHEARAFATGIDSISHVHPELEAELETSEAPATEVRATPPPNLSPDAAVACVLDTGLSTRNPWVPPVAGQVLDFSSTSPDDNNGHGTMVAGLVAYGEYFAGNPPPSLTRVHSAKIADSSHVYDDELERRIEAAVDALAPSCRVFNLSFNLNGDSLRSPLAERLDTLARTRDILFVNSAGNIGPLELARLEGAGSPFPTYFTNPRLHGTTIQGPADGAAILAVGSTVLRDHGPDNIAQRGHPAPHTRASDYLDPRYHCKPDVVHEGGNWKRIAGQFIPDIDRSPVSLHHRPQGNLVTERFVGTSFSAPLVAALAAHILRQRPTASTNLVRALILNTSRRPAGPRIPVDRRSIYGTGVPSWSRALANSPERITLYHEGRIRIGDTQSVSFTMPQEFVELPGEKRIRATLVYDPPVDRDERHHYALLYLTPTLEAPCTISAKEEGHNWAHSYQSVKHVEYSFNNRHRSFRNEGAGQWTIRIRSGHNRHMAASRRYREQRYAVVLTLEALAPGAEVYVPILNANRVRVRVR